VSKLLVRRPCGIVRASVPVPYFPPGEPPELSARSPSGATLAAQVDLVYAPSRRGAPGVVEVSFADPAPPSMPAVYEVVAGIEAAGLAQPGDAAAEAFRAGVPLDRGQGPELADWVCDRRDGALQHERWFALPWCRGAATFYDRRDVVRVDLAVHAAAAGSPHLFLERFRLALPSGWRAASAWPEPLGDEAAGSGLEPLSPRAPSAAAWVVVQRQARLFRLVCYADPADRALAEALARSEDFGASDQWAELPAWLPSGLPLPRLDARTAGLAATLEALAAGEWTGISTALRDGTSFGTNATVGLPARIGHFVPWGVAYGGTTGGADREVVAQKALAAVMSGAPEAISAIQAEAAMVLFRHPCLLLEGDGTPVALERWLDATGHPLGSWRLSAIGGEFEPGRDGAFGFAAASLERPASGAWVEQEVQAFGLGPGQYQRIDDQHLIRVWSPLVALALLRNDALAAWALRDLSEVWRMQQRTYGRLAGELAALDAWPGHGTLWGRGQGHPLAMAAATVVLSADAWRSRWRRHVAECAMLLDEARMPSGFRRAHPAYIKDGPVFFDAQGNALWATTTPDEEVYLEVGARCCELALGRSPAWPELALAVWRQAWQSGAAPGPADFLAVRGVARSSAPLESCSPRYHVDDAELGHAFAFAYADGSAQAYPEFAQAVGALCGNHADPIAGILAKMPNPYRASLYADDFAFLLRQLQP